MAILCTGSGIAMYRLLAARGVLSLACKGIKMRHTTAWAKVMQYELGLKKSAKYAEVLAAIEARIEQDRPKVVADGSIRKV